MMMAATVTAEKTQKPTFTGARAFPETGRWFRRCPALKLRRLATVGFPEARHIQRTLFRPRPTINDPVEDGIYQRR